MKNRHRLRSLRIHSNYPLSAFVSIIRLGNTRMIVDERLVTYINSLDRGNTPVLDEIEKEALRDFVPIIRKEMQSFFKAASCNAKTNAYSRGGNSGWFFCRFDGRVCTEGLSDSDRLKINEKKNYHNTQRPTLKEPGSRSRLHS